MLTVARFDGPREEALAMVLGQDVEHVAFLMIAVPRVSAWMCVDVRMCISRVFARVHEFDIRACAAEAGGVEPLIH